MSVNDRATVPHLVSPVSGERQQCGFLPARAPYVVPIPDTSHRYRLEENAAAVSIDISADTQTALLKVFAPGAARGLRYPEKHLVRLGI